MAIVFPLSTYRLSPKTAFEDVDSISRSEFSDGSMAIREIGASDYRIIQCKFVEMYLQEADDFAQYVRDNKAQEFDFVYLAKTYRGYIWSAPKTTFESGNVALVSFSFRGVLT